MTGIGSKAEYESHARQGKQSSGHRRLVLVAVVLVSLSLMGCESDPYGPYGKKIYDQMAMSRSNDPGARFGDGVFFVIEGQTHDEAISTLTSQGATCVESTCTWTKVEKETRLNTGWYPRQPGPFQTWVTTWRVVLSSPVINDRSDIVTYYTHERIE